MRKENSKNSNQEKGRLYYMILINIDYNLLNNDIGRKPVRETEMYLVTCERIRKQMHIFNNHHRVKSYVCSFTYVAVKPRKPHYVDVRKCNNVTQKRLITLLFAMMTSNRWKGARIKSATI